MSEEDKKEMSTEDMMSQLEALMNHAEAEKRTKVMKLVNNPLPTPKENYDRLESLGLLDTYKEMSKDGSFSDKKENSSKGVDLNVNMELSTAMWQAGRYTSFHYWLGDYPEGMIIFMLAISILYC